MTIRRTWNTYLKLQENFRKSLEKSRKTHYSIIDPSSKPWFGMVPTKPCTPNTSKPSNMYTRPISWEWMRLAWMVSPPPPLCFGIRKHHPYYISCLLLIFKVLPNHLRMRKLKLSWLVPVVWGPGPPSRSSSQYIHSPRFPTVPVYLPPLLAMKTMSHAIETPWNATHW